MNSRQVRQTFLDFFQDRAHHIISSAPMVVKNDPTLMFTNAGMNQFKDIFLDIEPATHHRIANSQKCLRVSGKHNDLEEVGHDTYHHTMFEMLGNWSFGDYFKREAIHWAWELLTGIFGIDKDRIYVTVFGGDESDGLAKDEEAHSYWKEIIEERRILNGSKKDNFWEMGDTGPCGPCSEIHVDIRNEAERKAVDGLTLVNEGHPQVIEIWNLVFIEFNRTSDGKLHPLPQKHVDTGMGFERLTMVLQGVQSNYDTDIFQEIIGEISRMSGIPYGQGRETDVAMRVIADHLRAVSFAIADGQLPSNNKAGYVIRRILRRAIRYAYTFLHQNEPFINRLVPVLVAQMGEHYRELVSQQTLITKVIAEEEHSFLRTLAQGIQRFNNYIAGKKPGEPIDGSFAFELYDTYGFPIDLTGLMAREDNRDVDMDAFHKKLEEQKERSRKDAAVGMGDWTILDSDSGVRFTGYDTLETQTRVLRHRSVEVKGKTQYQVVLAETPFYAESGGQVGDLGTLSFGGEVVDVLDTRRENNLIIHIVDKLPQDADLSQVTARVDEAKRTATANNHSATHLMHYALREVLGPHVEQKGSFVGPDYLRFDFSHFQKMTEEEIRDVESRVNRSVRSNHPIDERRETPFVEAQQAGALAFFGEKYGDVVRMIGFGPSIELCGGTHVHSTGQIGLFKIVNESAIAAGVRRIEAVTGEKAIAFYEEHLKQLNEVKELLKSPREPQKAAQALLSENAALRTRIEQAEARQAERLIPELIASMKKAGTYNLIYKHLETDIQVAKDLAFRIRNEADGLITLFTTLTDGKPGLLVALSDDIAGKALQAPVLAKELAQEINGGGGGQPFLATAGGKNPDGIRLIHPRLVEILTRS